MKYRSLGRTGIEVSCVSLGGAYLMGPDETLQEDTARAVVECARQLGINYIDTAPLYGNSEKLLGRVLTGLLVNFTSRPRWVLIRKIFIINAIQCWRVWSAVVGA